MRSARIFSPQLGHSTRASGSASPVSIEVAQAGQVCDVDAVDSAAIEPIVTSTIARATKVIASPFSSPLAKGRGRGEESLAGHDRSIQLYPSSCVEKRGATASRPISRARAPEVFAIASPTIDPQRMRQRSEEHTSELQSLRHLVCRLLLEK